MARAKGTYARKVHDRIFGQCVLVTHTTDAAEATTAALVVAPKIQLAEEGHYRCTPSQWGYHYNKVVPGRGASPGFLFTIKEA